MNQPTSSITFVCTANICRSPIAQEIMTSELANWPGSVKLPITINSFGTHAQSGDDRCAVASERFEIVEPGVSALFDGQAIGKQNLILTMEQAQMGFLVRTFPKFRSQIFTLPQAVEIASKIQVGINDGTLFTPVDPELSIGFVAPPMPETLADRWVWLLAELDANRGMITKTDSALTAGDLDIADAHQPDGPTHELALDLIQENTKTLATLIKSILDTDATVR
jgi:protein-tyrosine-phosphatase